MPQHRECTIGEALPNFSFLTDTSGRELDHTKLVHMPWKSQQHTLIRYHATTACNSNQAFSLKTKIRGETLFARAYQMHKVLVQQQLMMSYFMCMYILLLCTCASFSPQARGNFVALSSAGHAAGPWPPGRASVGRSLCPWLVCSGFAEEVFPKGKCHLEFLRKSRNRRSHARCCCV